MSEIETDSLRSRIAALFSGSGIGLKSLTAAPNRNLTPYEREWFGQFNTDDPERFKKFMEAVENRTVPSALLTEWGLSVPPMEVADARQRVMVDSLTNVVLLGDTPIDLGESASMKEVVKRLTEYHSDALYCDPSDKNPQPRRKGKSKYTRKKKRRCYAR